MPRDVTDCAGDPARLLGVEAALARVLGLAAPVAEVETAPLADATGRILAEDVAAPIPLPAFDHSAMDGYALCAADLAGEGPWRLPVRARIAAGDGAPAPLPPGAAARIFTGAPMPDGADAVLMQEHVRRTGDAIEVDAKPAPGANVRRRGEDAAVGTVVAPAGRAIGPREASAIAALGLAAVPVRRRLRAALLRSGSELRAPGEALGPGQIYDANRFGLTAALAAPSVALADAGAVPDDPALIGAALTRLAAEADLIVSSGGASVGDEDHMAAAARAAGGRIEALKVAMKPGKPLLCGRIGDAVYLGLPGNPVAALVAWTLFGAPLAARMAGAAPRRAPPLRVASAEAFSRRPGRREYRPAAFVDGGDPGATGGPPRVRPLDPRFSARIGGLAMADGLMVIPAEAEQVRAGEALDFIAL
jgi:molybdopterin molybdotransferase